MLIKDMDVNAGAYLDGTPMEELGESMLDLTVDVASGERSVGEKAGHSQVSLWRDWKQTGPVDLDPLLTESELQSGEPIPIEIPVDANAKRLKFRALQTEAGCRADQVAVNFADEPLFWPDCTDDCASL